MKKISKERLVLASASPRRSELLKLAGVEFDVVVADVDETVDETQPAADVVRELALRKAEHVATQHPERLVLGADTIVVLSEGDNSQILGKPRDDNEAVAMLRKLSGRMHHVYTGFCLRAMSQNFSKCEAVTTEVYFRELNEEEIHAYVATGSPLDKAGAYGIQDMSAAFVDRISGSYTCVVGLPLSQVVEALRDCHA